MAEIRVLDEQVANLIAAGEVVERPASAVKELVENAVDAGAGSITVEIKNGGITYIRVTDDGKGIARGDARTAFLRHATSKIARAEDLEAIHTLGFRGEALASIAAVSHTELLTKQKDQIEGTHVVVEGGKVLSEDGAGCPDGTTITVRNLFFNTPARMKFLKKDSTEAGYITDILQKIALGKPDISFKYINNGKEIFFTAGDGELLHVIHAIYGKDYAKNMVSVRYEKDGAAVEGYIGKSNLSRPNRNFQTFFVNGRCVVNKTIAFALSESYKNQIMIGKFPVAVLNVKVNPKTVDVNVHPAKTEIKFYNERIVYDVIYWGCKNALFQNVAVPDAKIAQSKKDAFRFPVPAVKTEQEKINISQASIPVYVPPKQEPPKGAPPVVMRVEEEYIPPKKQEEKVDAPLLPVQKKEVAPSPRPAEEEAIVVPEEIPFRIIGQVFQTYILIERDGALLFIDQHAAHERLNFEELKQRREKRAMESQVLLVPVVVELSPVEFNTYRENAAFFAELGFEMEEFGVNSLLVRMLPMDVVHDGIPSLIVELLSQISGNRKEVRGEKEERALYTIACKAAIKANHNLSKQELETLVSAVLRLEGINTCPHGRPICIQMTKHNIEKEFKRIQ